MYHTIFVWVAGFKAVILLDQRVLQKNIWETDILGWFLLYFVFFSMILLSCVLLYPQMCK